MKRFLLSLTLLLTSAGIAFAQSVTVNKIWLEKDVTLNGKQGMKIHFYLKTDGLKDVPMSAIAYFDEPKGVGLKDTDGRWCTTSGTVAIWADFTPTYESSVWDDYWFFTAYEDLHIKDYSKTYYCHVFIFDKQGKQYGNTDYVAFQVKKNENNQASKYAQKPAYGLLNGTVYMQDSENETVVIKMEFYTSGNQQMMKCNLGSISNTYMLVDSDEYIYNFKECQLQTSFGFNNISWRPVSHGHDIAIMKNWSRIGYNRVCNCDTHITAVEYERIKKIHDNFLNAMQSMNSGGGGGYSPGGGNYNSGSGGSTPSYDNNLSESYYREMYSMWERNAERAYNSLTTLGASITYSDGSKEGSTLGSWSSSDYTRLKQDLRKAQSEMRTIRSEASRAGYTIHPSHWESASVSY